MNKQELICEIEQKKIIVIMRGLDKKYVLPTAEALHRGGIRFIEVTFNQCGEIAETTDKIRLIAEKMQGRIHVGAGTVLTCEQVQAAFDAGAEYIISPDTNENVIKKANYLGMVSIPGALTPTEIAAAHRYGADFAKIFPASVMGSAYIKSVAAPLSHIKTMAVGGIDENNASEYFKAGVCGIGVGGNIIKKSYIENGEFDKITALAEKYAAAVGCGVRV